MPEGRHRGSPRALIIGAGVVALAAIGVLAVFLGRGASTVSRSTPAFSFSVGKAIGTSLEQGVNDRDVSDRADAVAAEIAPTLDLLYREAFLVPENLSSGNYDAVWELFGDEARPTAVDSAPTLTLGALGAGFDDVEPDRGRLSARVLFDVEGEAKLVAVQVLFRAIATPGPDGATPTTIVSRGEYLLERRGEEWVIVAFRVDREDENLPVPEVAS